MSNFALHLPINGVSFGQVSIALLREFYEMGLSPNLFSIGNPDVSSQKISPDFGNWINSCLSKAHIQHRRDTEIFKLWHIEGSLESYSKEQSLLTFYELDQPTDFELNTIRNNKRVIVTSNYTARILEDCGASNISVIHLGFDKHNFSVKNRKTLDDSIVFNVLGKYELRKAHKKTIQAWIKKYGNNPKYRLQCAIYNPFYSPQENEAIVNEILEGKRVYNVQFLGYMQQNELYNDFLNSGSIVLGLSGAEGFGLPEFHSLALGKHGVILNAHAYKDWATKDNAVLVKPYGKIPAYDGKFFVQGRHVNQGNIIDFNVDELIAGCEEAVKRYEKNPINTEGLKLQEQFTYRKTAESIVNLFK